MLNRSQEDNTPADSVFDPFNDEGPAEREGLPPGYRMRHDAHWVDRLSQPAAPPIRMVSIGEIDAPPLADAADLEPLVASVARFGLLQPLLVRRRSGRYQLIAGARRLAAATSAGLAEVPCVLHEVDDEQVRALYEAANTRASGSAARAEPDRGLDALSAGAIGDLPSHLEAIASCLNLFAADDRPLRERVAIELIRAELEQAAWLSHSLSLLARETPLMRRPTAVGSVLQRVVDGTQLERAVTGLRVDVVCHEPVPDVQVDERLLALALTGVLGAMTSLAARSHDRELQCVVRQEGSALSIAVTHTRAALSTRQLSQFFDPDWSERPGGTRAAVGVLTAKRVLEMHGGSTEVGVNESGACTVRLLLPVH
ncbi:MAG: ParB/RepB/Spo0J family partition protein [Bacteroidales bacterium]